MDKRMPDAELSIMQILWRHTQPLRTSDILQELDNGWTISTVKVLLERLCTRGFAACLREGRFALYEAVLSEKEYRTQETDGLLQRYYQSSAKKLIASLVQSENLTSKDIAEISAMLKEACEKNE